MSTQPLNEAEKVGVRKLVLHYDKSGKGTLEFDEFIHFLKALPSINLEHFTPEEINETDVDIPVEKLRVIYDGMDLNGKHSINAGEVCEYLNATRTNDFKWQTKMVFRAADKDKSRKVSFEELSSAVNNIQGLQLTKDEFNSRCKLELGKSKSQLEYWEFYKIISGQELDHETDPYDGKLIEKSKCCLLL